MKPKRLGMFLAALMLLMTAALIIPCSSTWAKGPLVTAGFYATLGLQADGTVVGAGSNAAGQLSVSAWTDISATAAGAYHTLGLKSDGTVVAVGSNGHGQTDVSSWTGITAIAAGTNHTVGLKSNGTVVGAGDNGAGQSDFSSWTGLTITAIAAGGDNTVGLKSDGTVVTVGDNTYGQLSVSSWTNIVAIAAGTNHTVGLKSNGTVVTTASNGDISSWTNIVAVAGGYDYTVGLKSDGTAVAVGDHSWAQTEVSAWTDIVAIATGAHHTVGLKPDGTVVALGYNGDGETNVSSWQLQTLPTQFEGGMGTEVVLDGLGFGRKKGTVAIGATPARVTAWFDTVVVVQVLTSLPPAEYPLYVTPVGGSAITYGKPFIMKPPELQLVLSSQGAPGDTVVLTGKYFGSKKGTIALGTKSCPVSYWYMDRTTGESIAAFKIPPKMAPENYNVTLANGVGSSKFPTAAFTVTSKGTPAGSRRLPGDAPSGMSTNRRGGKP